MRWRESSEPAKITRILVLGMVSLEVQNFALSAVPCVEVAVLLENIYENSPKIR